MERIPPRQCHYSSLRVYAWRRAEQAGIGDKKIFETVHLPERIGGAFAFVLPHGTGRKQMNSHKACQAIWERLGQFLEIVPVEQAWAVHKPWIKRCRTGF